MSTHFRSGPSGGGRWEERLIGDGQDPPRSALLLPDASVDGPAIFYFLPALPLLRRDSLGRPILSLTMLLGHQPQPEDPSIYPLVEKATLGLGLTLAMPANARAELEESTLKSAELRPLFARDVQLRLEWQREGSSHVVTSLSGSGAEANLALSVTLDRQQALDCLEALQGRPSNLHLICAVSYRTAGSVQSLRLTGNWAAIHDYLSAHSDSKGEFSQLEIRQHLADMVNAGILRVDTATASREDLPEPSLLLLPFLRVSSVILRRTTPELSMEDSANRYVLRARPDENFCLDLRQTSTIPREESIELAATLDEILRNALKGFDPSAFIHLVCTSATGIGPAPPRMRQAQFPVESRDAGRRVGLAAVNGSLRSLSLSLRPEAKRVPTAEAILASETIRERKVLAGNIKRWLVDDLVIEKPIEIVGGSGRLSGESLPVIGNQQDPFWPDRVREDQYWYAPVFDVTQPAANADRETSPFLFRFTESGHDASGKSGLEATIRISLRARMSEETSVALEELGNSRRVVHPVPLDGLSVGLALPFRDQSGTTRTQLFPAEVENSEETIIATVRLLDDWVRLSYGALAVAGFQTQPAHIEIAYTYRAYVPVNPGKIDVIYGGKIALTPIVYSRLSEVETRPHINAALLSVKLPVGEFRFAREAPNAADAPPAAYAARAGLSHHNDPAQGIGGRAASELRRPSAVATTHVVASGALLARPSIESAVVIEKIAERRPLGVQTLGQQASVDVLVPCNTLGAFYVHLSGGVQTSIGCLDHMQLGQTVYRQYELIAELDNSRYRVYRSLQQPGRFLVVPSRYRITRFAASEGDKAYRPAIFLYSSVDASRPEENRGVILATLEPDLPRFVRRQLLGTLGSLAQSPIIEYPTEIETKLSYEWGGALGIEAKATKLWDSFQVSLETKLDTVPLLQSMLQTSGISARVIFTLPDGMTLETAFDVNLSEIVGPWTDGPIEVSTTSTTATLRNRIEGDINISDLLLFDTGSVRKLPVERLLGPGESVTTSEVSANEIYPKYTIAQAAAASLTEIRSFIEDIHTNVVFVNLVNYLNNNLKKIEIKARLKDVEGTYTVPISEEEPVAAVDFVLPLTTYLTNRILQFQVEKVNSSDQATQTDWLEWPLDSKGNVVSLTAKIVVHGEL